MFLNTKNNLPICKQTKLVKFVVINIFASVFIEEVLYGGLVQYQTLDTYNTIFAIIFQP